MASPSSIYSSYSKSPILPREQVLATIPKMDSRDQIMKLKGYVKVYYPDDKALKKAISDRVDFLWKSAEQAVSNQRGFGIREYLDCEFELKIAEKIPPNTYTEIKVTTIPDYQFTHKQMKARKIELMRIEWGLINVPIIESIGAFFRSMSEDNSPYREILCTDLLMRGILAASIVECSNTNREAFTKQITAAYWCGKSIEIIIPFDYSENGVVTLRSESSLLSFSIDAGRWFRSIFTSD